MKRPEPESYDDAWARERRRRQRNVNIERMLGAFDLDAEDFMNWLEEHGIKPVPRAADVG